MGWYLFVSMILVVWLMSGSVAGKTEDVIQNDTLPLVMDDPVAEVIEHDNMAFFAILFMLCK